MAQKTLCLGLVTLHFSIAVPVTVTAYEVGGEVQVATPGVRGGGEDQEVRPNNDAVYLRNRLIVGRSCTCWAI